MSTSMSMSMKSYLHILFLSPVVFWSLVIWRITNILHYYQEKIVFVVQKNLWQTLPWTEQFHCLLSGAQATLWDVQWKVTCLSCFDTVTFRLCFKKVTCLVYFCLVSSQEAKSHLTTWSKAVFICTTKIGFQIKALCPSDEFSLM